MSLQREVMINKTWQSLTRPAAAEMAGPGMGLHLNLPGSAPGEKRR